MRRTATSTHDVSKHTKPPTGRTDSLRQPRQARLQSDPMVEHGTHKHVVCPPPLPSLPVLLMVHTSCPTSTLSILALFLSLPQSPTINPFAFRPLPSSSSHSFFAFLHLSLLQPPFYPSLPHTIHLSTLIFSMYVRIYPTTTIIYLCIYHNTTQSVLLPPAFPSLTFLSSTVQCFLTFISLSLHSFSIKNQRSYEGKLRHK